MECNELEIKRYLDKDLAQWAQESGTSAKWLTALLSILRYHGRNELPKDGRTLLQTPNNAEDFIISVPPGEYVSQFWGRSLIMIFQSIRISLSFIF